MTKKWKKFTAEKVFCYFFDQKLPWKEASANGDG
jgi:hypothetical protein